MPTPLLRSPWIIALLILVLNIPFGYWRASVRKRSVAWFTAIHVPVVLAIAMRWALGVAFRAAAIPLYVGAFVAGQSLGGWIHRRRVAVARAPAVP